MTLVSRIKRLVKADAFALIEGMEDPKWILAQAIRDMEEELQSESKLLEERKMTLVKIRNSLSQLGETIKLNESDIELAMNEKRDDIAKALIRKKIVCETRLKNLRSEEKALHEAVGKSEEQFLKRKQSYADIVQRSENLEWKNEFCSDAFSCANEITNSTGVIDHEVEIEFLRRLRETKKDR